MVTQTTTTQEITAPGYTSGGVADRLRRFSWNFTDTFVVARRNLTRYIRLPQLLVFSTIQPVMFVLLFAFVFGGAITVPGDFAYIDYLIPGIMVQTVLFGGSNTTVGLAEDLSRGMVDRFRSLPMARSAVLAGRTLADTVRNLFVVVLMVIVGTLIGFRFQNGIVSAIAAMLIVVAFGHAFSWISAYLGLITKDPETAQVAGFVWVFPLVFASSAFVPVETMPDWLRAFAEVQPISQTVNAARFLTLGDAAPGASIDNVWTAQLWMAGIMAVFVPLSIRQYRRIS
ncbi:MAG: ABC transporter permease [Chloroflexi bacterium]|nr:ABC transporter permease [Chloroflexota bacterium]